MLTNILKNKWTWIAVAIIVFMLLFFFWARKKGRLQAAPKIPGDNPENPLTEEEKKIINTLTERLVKDIDSFWASWSRDNDVYKTLANASDKVFVGVYNLYKEKTGTSLRADMQNEQYWWADISLQSDINNLFGRFDRLKLY